MSATRRDRGPTDPTATVVCAAALTAAAGAVLLWGAVAITAAVTPDVPPPGGNPFATAVDLLSGQRPWPGPIATLALAGEILLAATGGGVTVWALRHRHATTRVDAAARHMATQRELYPYTQDGALATARRLGSSPHWPGVLIGRDVHSGRLLYGSPEDTHCDIWGPRTGKTTCRAIPAIVEAPGAVLVTSNKRDVVDATRGVRERSGPVWIFDPQGLIGQEPAWWWNPLSHVTDVDKAMRLAAIFAAYSRDAGARTDAYFDPEGQALLSFMLLAAAIDGRPITQVYKWLTDHLDTTPVEILRAAGYTLAADSVHDTITMPEEQRGGIYGTAKKAVSFLANPGITRWVTPNPGLPQFNPATVVHSGRGTLYSLSQEGRAVAAPLVTALAVAVIEAAEEVAATCPGGRLPVPFLGVLDEAANVCRWRELPNLYSHYGSRGIILMTILQTWAQAVEAWGEHGAAMLWGAANVRVYGGGDIDSKFLANLSTLIGDFASPTRSLSISHNPQGHSRSYTISTRVERVLDPADLFALPRGRAVAYLSGTRPVLIEPIPWYRTRHAAEIEVSLRTYAPASPAKTSGPTSSAVEVR